MSTDNTSTPSAPVSSAPSGAGRADRSTTGWARDNTPAPHAAQPAEAGNVKPASARSAARKKFDDDTDLVGNGKVVTDYGGPATSLVAAAENTNRDNIASTPRSADVPNATSEVASTAEQVFDRKGDRVASDWGRDAPAPLVGGSTSLYTLLGGGLLTAGLVGKVGSGSSSGSDAASAVYKAVVLDGLIGGAQVFVGSTQVGTTDKVTGAIVLTQQPGAGIIKVVGGFNIDTGLPNTLELKSTATFVQGGTIVISPVTTLVAELVAKGMTEAQAQTRVKTALGISSAIDLNSYDPLAADHINTPDGLKLQKAGAELAAIGSSSSFADTAFTDLASYLVSHSTATNLDLSNLATLQQIYSTPTDAAYQELSNVASANAAILGATSASDVAAKQLSQAAPVIMGLQVDSGSSSSDHITNDARLMIAGLNKSAVVELSVDGGKTWVAQDAFAPADGSYSVIARLHYGNGLVTASSNTFDFTLNTAVPSAPHLVLQTDTGVSATDHITSQSAVTVSGQTSGMTLEYSSDNVHWGTDKPTAVEGANDFYARQTNPLTGSSSAVTKLSFVLDTHADPGTMSLGANTEDVTNDSGSSATDGVTNNNHPQLAGHTEAGATSVDVSLAGHTYHVSDLHSDGTWTLDLPSTLHLADGTYTPTVTITDAAGNTSAPMAMTPVVIDTAAPADATGQLASTSDSGFSSVDGLTNINRPEIVGHTEAFATVSVDLGLDSPFITQADKNGNWKVVVSTALDDGEYTPSITVIDLAGNESDPIDGTPFTVMATGPEEASYTTLVDDPEIDTGVSSTDGITSNVLPTLTGTLDSSVGDVTSTVVVVSLAGHTYVTQPDDSGVWTIQIPEGRELEDGVYTPQITYLDPAGNIIHSGVTYLDASGNPTVHTITVDTTPPDGETVTADLVHDAESDTGLSHFDGATNNNSPWIAGTADPFAHVVVDLNGSLFETEADANGDWKVQADGLDDGEYTPQITVTDLAGNVSDTIDSGNTFVISTTPPDAPTGALVHDDVSDTGLAIDDNITSNNHPSFEGTAAADAQVTLTFETPGHHFLTFTTLADSDGNWSVALDKPLPDGQYTPVVSITDVVGNVGSSELDPLVIDTTAPSASTVTVGLDPDSDTGISSTDGITNNNAPTLVGTTDANSLIHVDIGSAGYDTQADEDGNWSIALDTLDDGMYTPVVHVVDAAGNESTGINGSPITIDTTVPDASDATAHLVHDAVNDTGINVEDGLTNNASPWFEGTAEAFAHVTLDLNGSTFETDADSHGNWRLQANGLDDGDYTPLITISDRAGNSGDAVQGEPFTLLTAGPDAPTGNMVHDDYNDTGVAIDDSITANNAPAFEGTAVPDSEVTLTFNTGGGHSLSFSTTSDADGNWTLQLDKPLPDGVYTPTASVTDAYGNISVTELDPLTIDTTAPNAHTVTAGLTADADNDTGVSFTDGITNNNAPNISGSADPFSLIRVDVAGASYFTDADETGSWSLALDGTDDGTYTPVVYVVDAAGNASDPINSHAFTIDTAVPSVLTAGLLHNAANDTGISANDGVTNNSKPALSGTTEAFATVSVDFGDITYDTQADSHGLWTLIPKNPLPDGEYVPVITVIDRAGNVSDAIEGDTVVIKTSIANASGGLTHDDVNDTGASTDDGITNNNMPSLSGLADAGSTVVVTLGGVRYSTVSDADGVWSIDTTATLADGVYAPTIQVTDLAGNTSSFRGDSITIDTIAGMPGGDVGLHQVVMAGVKINFNPIPAGLSETDATVEDYSGNLPDGLSIDAHGHIVGTATTTGSTWIQVTANDLAGNTATQSFQLTVTAVEKDASTNTLSITSPYPEKAGLYVGTAGADHLNVYASANDVILGGEGNDLYQMFRPASLGFARLDGGSGVDQVNFSGTDLVFDFSAFNNPDGTGQVVEHIESFYFLGVHSDITVTAADLFHLRSDSLDVDGQHQMVRFMSSSTNGGTVAMDGLTQVGGVDAWGATGAKTTGAANDKYTKFVGTYTDSSGDHLVELLIQHGLHAA